MGTGGFAFDLVEDVASDETDADATLERSDASLLSTSMSSLDSYFRTGFGIEGNASQFTHFVVVVSARNMPLQSK